MKKLITCLTLAIFVFLLSTTAFATAKDPQLSESTPVEITLSDAYEVDTITITLEDKEEQSQKIVFAKKDNFTTITTLPAGDYKIVSCESKSSNNNTYSFNLESATFTVPQSTSLTKLSFVTGQKPKEASFFDYLSQSKGPIIVLAICAVLYFIITKKEKRITKTVNPKFQQMMEEHEARQEALQTEKVNIAQYENRQGNTSKDYNFDNEYADVEIPEEE